MAAVLAMGLLASMPIADAATAPYCGITWGSTNKLTTTGTSAPITGARTGRHDCWDRLVLDLAGKPPPGSHVRYTDGFRTASGSASLPITGGAVLTITSFSAATVPWSVGTHIATPSQFGAAGYRTFRDLVYGGNYENSEIAIGLGVRARLPFRVFTLDGPGGGSRLVVDVAHRW